MAGGNTSGEKTEKPTPHRLEKAREEGQVTKSQELNLAFTLLGSFMALHFLFDKLFASLANKMTLCLSLGKIEEMTKATAYNLIIGNLFYIAKLVAPLMFASAIIGGLISFLQVGPIFSVKSITPQFNRINPIEGFKRLFSLRSVVELIKSLAKATIIGALTYSQLKLVLPDLISLNQQGIRSGLSLIRDLIYHLAVNIIIFLIILGIFDYIYQRKEFIKNLMMTKQEIKEEYKESEGDPQIKGKRRQLQRQMSMNRMIQAMEEADVVITNPTHIAVALKFDIEMMEAPLVIAKGEGFIAEKIKEKARELKIEIVENRPLARALNKTTEIGQEIPIELYQAVAEVLAFVYRNNHKYKKL